MWSILAEKVVTPLSTFNRYSLLATFLVLVSVSLAAYLSLSLNLRPQQEIKDVNSRCPVESDIKQNVAKRKQTINKFCRRQTKSRFRQLDWSRFGPREFQYSDLNDPGIWWDNLAVNEQYKVVFCTAPKVGNTNMRHYVMHLSEQAGKTFSAEFPTHLYKTDKLMKIHLQNFTSPHLRRLANYSLEDAQRILEKYTKIAFARPPLERLVSAWKNKFSKIDSDKINQAYYSTLGSAILKRFRQNASDLEIAKGLPITITEFFQFLSDEPDPRTFEHHWRPLQYVCNFCKISYDFIGEMDSFSCDLEYFARHFTALAEVPRVPEPPLPSSRRFKSILYGVSPSLLHGVLMKHYVDDYEMFGYKFPSLLNDVLNDDGRAIV